VPNPVADIPPGRFGELVEIANAALLFWPATLGSFAAGSTVTAHGAHQI
jgi:hypothetical protein